MDCPTRPERAPDRRHARHIENGEARKHRQDLHQRDEGGTPGERGQMQRAADVILHRRYHGAGHGGDGQRHEGIWPRIGAQVGRRRRQAGGDHGRRSARTAGTVQPARPAPPPRRRSPPEPGSAAPARPLPAGGGEEQRVGAKLRRRHMLSSVDTDDERGQRGQPRVQQPAGSRRRARTDNPPERD